jgi:hypothetical protein
MSTLTKEKVKQKEFTFVSDKIISTYQLKVDKASTIIVIPGGTANCQATVVYNFASLMGGTYTDKEINDLFWYVYGSIDSRKQFIIDTYKGYEDRIRKIFPEILSIAPYENGTGSNMILCMVHLDADYEDKEDDDYYEEEDEWDDNDD